MKQLSIWLPTVMLTMVLAIEAPNLIQHATKAPFLSADNGTNRLSGARSSDLYIGDNAEGNRNIDAVISEPFIGTIIMFGGNFAPQGWAKCDGQLLQIAQNSALFSILGTTYGGDGEVTFGLPDLRGRVPIHAGNGPGLPSYNLGQKGGAHEVVLTTNQIPSHSHSVEPGARNGAGDDTNPGGGYMASTATDLYAENSVGGIKMGATESNNTGGGQSHTNMQPFTGVNFIIALTGIFPSP